MHSASPWLQQLRLQRTTKPVSGDLKTEVLIIGGGIAGIATAYFLLTRTSADVVMIEADKIAHGATGHNAGQVTSYFERHFVELVEDFGLEMAAEGAAAVEGAWELLEEMIKKASLSVPLYQFTGYAGYSTLDQLLLRLEEESLRLKAGLPAHEFLVKNDPLIILRIPEEQDSLYRAVTPEELKDALETDSDDYIAAKASRKGCLNSALFCEQLVEWMEQVYPQRLRIFEHTPVERLRLGADSVTAETAAGAVGADKVVLCTNGFESIEIINEAGLDVDGRFHEVLYGTIGYMAGYLGDDKRPPTATSYFEGAHDDDLDPYAYLTRRPDSARGSLICVGGPEALLEEKGIYDRRTHLYPEAAKAEINNFMQRNYRGYPDAVEYDFLWHGLMGYTKNGVRLIGAEPCNKRLLYNLGCNGIGILPSLYGGWRISSLISGEELPPSMFDVIDRRAT